MKRTSPTAIAIGDVASSSEPRDATRQARVDGANSSAREHVSLGREARVTVIVTILRGPGEELAGREACKRRVDGCKDSKAGRFLQGVSERRGALASIP